MKVPSIASALLCSLALTMPASQLQAGENDRPQLPSLLNPRLYWEAPCTGCAHKAAQDTKNTSSEKRNQSAGKTKQAGTPQAKTTKRPAKSRTDLWSTYQRNGGGLLSHLWPSSKKRNSKSTAPAQTPKRPQVAQTKTTPKTAAAPEILIPYPAGETQPVHVAQIPSFSEALSPLENNSGPAVSAASSKEHHATTHYWGAVRASISDGLKETASPRLLEETAATAAAPRPLKATQSNAKASLTKINWAPQDGSESKVAASPQATTSEAKAATTSEAKAATTSEAKPVDKLKAPAETPRLLTPGSASPLQQPADETE